MKTDAIQVAIDILSELGHEDVAKWVERPDAVRELLKHQPTWADNDLECGGCRVWFGAPHERICPVAAAWRALGDPRGAADIERAHEEALREHRPGQWVQLERTPAGRVMQVEALLRDGYITNDMARRALEYPTGVAGGIVTQPRQR